MLVCSWAGVIVPQSPNRPFSLFARFANVSTGSPDSPAVLVVGDAASVSGLASHGAYYHNQALQFTEAPAAEISDVGMFLGGSY